MLTLVQALGTGVFLTSSAIFFTQVVGLAPAEVGLGLSIAGLCGFAVVVPIAKIADRLGARLPLAAHYAALAVLFLFFPFVASFPAFVVVATLVAVCETAGSPLRSALAHALFGGDAIRVRAQMRSTFNLGFAVGAALSGVAVAAGGRGGFVAVLLANAAAQSICALLALRLRPRHEPTPRARGRVGTSALRDLPFVAVSLLSGALELYQPIIAVGLPLWIVTHTSASPVLNSALLVLNTVFVLLFQVRMSRGADSVTGGARSQRRAGLLLAAACVVFAVSEDRAVWLVILLLLAGSVVLVFGELAQAAGSYALSFELPPPGRQGEYQGVFALGRGFQQFAGPVLVTSLAVGLGALGWLVLAALFVVLGLLTGPVVAMAERKRGA